MRVLFLLVVLATVITSAERIAITGSSTVAPLVAEMARAFEGQHPQVRIDVQTGGSSRGIADVRAGRCHIGMASRAVRPGAEDDLRAQVIAYDGIACIVHRDQTVRDLDRAQVIGIFTGAITSWSAVGGSGAAPLVVSKAEGRATLELFCAHFDLNAAQIKARSVIGDNAHGIKTVAAHADSIGYVSIGAAEAAIADGVAIRMVALDGVSPSLASLRTGVWPLARPLVLLTRGDLTPVVADFLAFTRTAAVDALVMELGFVPPPR